MKLLIVFAMFWAGAYTFMPRLTLSFSAEETDEDNFWKIPRINLLPRLPAAKSGNNQTLTELLENMMETKLTILPLKRKLMEMTTAPAPHRSQKPSQQEYHHSDRGGGGGDRSGGGGGGGCGCDEGYFT